jgi:hypothetical protein
MERHWSDLRLACVANTVALLLCVLPAAAQQPTPKNPTTFVANSSPSDFEPLKDTALRADVRTRDVAAPNSRLFGSILNYATVEGEPSAPALTTGGKRNLTFRGAFDPYEFAIVGALAAMNQDQDPSFGQGVKGYGKRYAVGFADQAIGNVMTGAVFPSPLRQGPSYYQRERGSFFNRFDYAISRIFVTRADSGNMQFNYSEGLGNAAAAGISLLYGPASDRTLSNALSTWETQIAIDAVAYEAKEFWPDIRRKIFRKNRDN